jgi:hypothetical protein
MMIVVDLRQDLRSVVVYDFVPIMAETSHSIDISIVVNERLFRFRKGVIFNGQLSINIYVPRIIVEIEDMSYFHQSMILGS